MAYKVIILYRLYMPSYVLGTFTEYPSLYTEKTMYKEEFLFYRSTRILCLCLLLSAYRQEQYHQGPGN